MRTVPPTHLPEGPEIRRVADVFAAAITGQRLTRVFFAFDHLQPAYNACWQHD